MEQINIYQANDTMRILGKQTAGEITPECFERIKDVKRAHMKIIQDFDINWMLIDVFILGVMRGKQIERARKRHGSRATPSRNAQNQK